MNIRQVEEKDIPALTEIMAHAFAREEFNRWIFKDEPTAIRDGQKLFAIMARRDVNDGYFFISEDKQSGIMCVPPQVQKTFLLKDILMLLQMIPVVKTKFFFLLKIFKQMEAMKPKEPHFYIGVLGVHPSQQRGGRGVDLLNHVLRICDEKGWMAYLENPVHLIPFYERFGFRVRESYDIPKVGMTMYTMSRLPKKI